MHYAPETFKMWSFNILLKFDYFTTLRYKSWREFGMIWSGLVKVDCYFPKEPHSTKLSAVFPVLAKFRQMGEIQVLGGDGFFADGDGEIWLQNSQKWAKLDNFAKIDHFWPIFT